MEQGVMSLFGNLGVAGVGFFFVYFILQQKFKADNAMLQQKFKSDNVMLESVEKLCAKIDKLVDSIILLQQESADSANKSNLAIEEAKENYVKISNKIDGQNERMGAILLTVDRIYNMAKSNMPLGTIAVAKGYLTKEQLDECLEEQKKYK